MKAAKKNKTPAHRATKGKFTNKSVDDSGLSNTIIDLNPRKTSTQENSSKAFDGASTAAHDSKPTPMMQISTTTNEKATISAWDATNNGRDSGLQCRDSALDADSETNLQTPVYIKSRSGGYSRLSNQGGGTQGSARNQKEEAVHSLWMNKRTLDPKKLNSIRKAGHKRFDSGHFMAPAELTSLKAD